MFPFDADVLDSSYALYNAAIWPAQAVGLALALVALWLCASPTRHGSRTIGVILAGAWLWCGFVFHLDHFANLDFMAPVYGWVFVLQAALLLWGFTWRGTAISFSADTAGVVGLAVAGFALFGLPLVSGLAEAGFASARVVGVAPGPTALFTLGVLLLTAGRVSRVLMILPLLWCAVAGVQAWALNIAEAWPLPVLGLVALAVSLLPSRARGRPC